MNLRAYQQSAVDAVEAGWPHARKQLGVAATGAGPRVELYCHFCFGQFFVEPYREGRAKYCGWICKQKAGAESAARVIADKYRGTGTRGYIKQRGRHQHRVAAERKLGRALLPGEIVHHIDGNKHNNSPENLQVMTQSDHIREHHKEMMLARKEKHGY